MKALFERRVAALTLIVAGLGIATIGAMPAHGRVVADSTLTISKFAPLYHGKVKSNFNKCKRHRRVTLWRQQPGPDWKIGSDRTNRRGKWRVNAPANLASGDRLYAKVRTREVSTKGTGLVCLRDRSRTVTFVGA